MTEERNLSEVELDKVKAETEKIKNETEIAKNKAAAEISRAEAEAQKFAAERDKALIEVTLFKQNAEAGRINLDQMVRQEKAALATDLFHQTYFFDQEVNDRSINACKERITYWSRTQPGCDIEIVFSSPGGSVFDGLVLYDFIQILKRPGVFADGTPRPAHRITTGALGMAASMAGILLQAGNTRYIGKEAWLLIHEISSLAWGKSSAIEDEVEFLKRIQTRVINIFLDNQKKAIDAGTCHVKPMTAAQFEKMWKRKDWWLDSDNAMKLGFVDEVR